MKTEQDIAQAGSTEELCLIYEAWIAEQPHRKDYGCAMETLHAVLAKALPGGIYEIRWLGVFNDRWDELQRAEDQLRYQSATN